MVITCNLNFPSNPFHLGHVDSNVHLTVTQISHTQLVIDGFHHDISTLSSIHPNRLGKPQFRSVFGVNVCYIFASWPYTYYYENETICN